MASDSKAHTVATDAISVDASAARKPAPLRWDELALRTPPSREWIMDGWIPAGQTTLLSGRGGEGKTAVAQHIATCVALGRSYIDAILTAGPVLMWAGEDDEAELWRRQAAICAWLRVGLTELTERLFLYSFVDHDMSLCATAYGTLQPTPLMRHLAGQVRDLKPRLVILDNTSRIFGGQEQDRNHVMTFCAWLRAACSPAALLLLGHTAKPSESEYSGSTAWENAVRARLLFSSRPPDAESGSGGEDESVRYISRRKLNAPGGRLTHRLTWQNDALVPAARAGLTPRSAAGREARYALI